MSMLDVRNAFATLGLKSLRAIAASCHMGHTYAEGYFRGDIQLKAPQVLRIYKAFVREAYGLSYWESLSNKVARSLVTAAVVHANLSDYVSLAKRPYCGLPTPEEVMQEKEDEDESQDQINEE